MSNRSTYIIAGILLAAMFLLAVFSMKDDSCTMDEMAHLPAGYSYLTQKDMRLNPEHPPLIKVLAAIPLLFIDGINFPSQIKAWTQDVNSQWDFGAYFLYQTGNPVDKMLFWGRIPMILLLILLGFYVFRWARELGGNKAGLLALFLFSFSPTFLAHGRLVTTDVGAAAGVFIALYYFIRVLKAPTAKNIFLAGIFFGVAELLKFSVILLVPLFIFLAFVYWLAKLRGFKETLKILILTFIIGYLLVGVVYQYHVWNYPPERQAADAKVFLAAYPEFLQNALIWTSNKPVLRTYGQYLTGLFMVFNRATGGNTTYFLGEVSNQGWKNYFPIVYSIKEPLTFHILSLAALLYAVWLSQLWPKGLFGRIKNWLGAHFPEFSMLCFIALYWLSSLTSNLNIGVRHLLPTLPLVMVLSSIVIIKLLKEPFLKLKYLLLFLLIFWQAFSVIKVFPHFLAYFNELAGGPDQGYIYTVDSNLDWGQDLKRLASWVEENGIQKIKIAYFGGGSPNYYLGDKAEGFNWSEPQKGWLAVSATLLQGGRGTPALGFDQPSGFFNWLDQYQPIAKIGYSIFIYHIK
jgi:hypothetical protein